ncbi:unnamed protein product [Rhizophagus irregularis]|nr:unnamed protein product [Rhizophagus irregularis]
MMDSDQEFTSSSSSSLSDNAIHLNQNMYRTIKKKKKRAQAANYLIENNDKYIRRYPEKELVQILKEFGYHSEE